MSGSRVDPYLRYVDEPYGDHAELGAARSELAAAVLPLLPAGSTVHTPTIERTDAGRAQANAVTPRETNVAIDVELNIRLPTSSRFPSGVQFKPDGIRFLPNRRYLFLEHKEVMTIWSKSHYSRDFAKREIEIFCNAMQTYISICAPMAVLDFSLARTATASPILSRMRCRTSAARDGRDCSPLF